MNNVKLAITAVVALTLGTAHADLSIPDQYVVVLDPQAVTASVAPTARNLVDGVGGGPILHVYEHALLGFAVRLPARAASALGADPAVLFVEQDRTMRFVETQVDPPSWGLDRIDQRELPLDGVYGFPSDPGAGVNVYVIDSGLRDSHVDFEGRVGVGRNFAPGSDAGLLCEVLGLLCPPTDPEDTSDCNGHGTHVSGTAVGTDFGVAKGAIVYPVRVFGCLGVTMTSRVIAGVDWVTGNHNSPAVANLSLGGGGSNALDAAVRGMIEQGVTAAVAAGNDGANACDASPARVEEAITVGSTTEDDARSSFSNVGPCVDLFAPGSGITSAWHTGDTASNTISGTSMASPHVAGAAARFLAADPQASPAEVGDFLVENATAGVVADRGNDSPNLLLFMDPAGP